MPKGKGQATVKDVLHKFKGGKLHSGSKKEPVVTSRKQAIAIGMSEGGIARTKPAQASQ